MASEGGPLELPKEFSLSPIWIKLDVCARFGLRLKDLAAMDPGEVAHLAAYCVLKQQMEARAAGLGLGGG